MAVAIHLGDTIPAYRQRNADDASADLAVASSPVSIVVADDVFTTQLLLFPLYNHRIVLLADTTESGARLGDLLADGRTGALLVSRNSPPAQVVVPNWCAADCVRGRAD